MGLGSFSKYIFALRAQCAACVCAQKSHRTVTSRPVYKTTKPVVCAFHSFFFAYVYVCQSQLIERPFRWLLAGDDSLFLAETGRDYALS